MNGIFLFVIGVVVGVIMLIVVACIADKSDSDTTSYSKQPFDLHGLSFVLFMTLVYYMSDCIDKETIINYITNAIKIGMNKGLIEFKQDEARVSECAESLYESVIQTFNEE